MQVSFTYRESTGEYQVDAEVINNRVTIVAITDDYRQDIDPDDFSQSERREMTALALQEYHNLMNDDSDDSPLDSEDEGEEGYA